MAANKSIKHLLFIIWTIAVSCPPLTYAQRAFDRPVAGVGIELKGAGELLVIQFNRGVQEVRTGGVIPLAELHDANGLTRGGGKLPPERSAEPERLQFHLRRKPRPVLRDQSRRSVNIVAQGSVGHQVLSLEKTGEVIKS